MRTRTVTAVAVGLILIVAAAKFLSDNSHLLARLPETRVDQARKEALRTPFLQREHRLERKAHLEAERAETTFVVSDNGLSGASTQVQSSRLATAREKKRLTKYHVVATVDGEIYTEWQVRVCYYWYKKALKKFPDSPMGGFTRLLHSGKADSLMDEIPTVVVKPLPQGVDQGYVVLNRPFAFLQWVQESMPLIEEEYILMLEPDHLFVQPPPLWATPEKAAAYPFTYIKPRANNKLIKRFNDKRVPVGTMAPIGNSPVQIHRHHLEGIVETWFNTSLRMKKDPDVDHAFGWILEMYAFSIASSQAEGGPIPFDLRKDFMAQPPFDPAMDVDGMPVPLIHLTYAMAYDKNGIMVYGRKGDWYNWDKRDYVDSYPPRNLALPPPPVNAPAVNFLISAINEASENLSWGISPRADGAGA